jgi:hypothetical protein
MTRWVDPGTAGRERGVRGIGRAWLAVLVTPRRFFRSAVAPGDQVPGLTFAVAVAAPAVVAAVLTGPVPTPFTGRPVASRLFVAAALVVLVAPLVLHLAAALQTVALLVVAPERGGVSETVQVIAYASAPCALAGVPSPAVQAACALYATGLLVVGTSEVHSVSIPVAALAAAPAATLAFGYGYRGVAAAAALAEVFV